jgi:tRNA (pseudouridine54-N1)-methyltransferase
MAVLPARRFLVVGHTQSTDPGLSLNDLPGAGGRIDVLARVVTAALCLSHGLRSDTEVWTVIDHEGVHAGPRTIVWSGDRLRHLNPDERTTAALFKKAFGADVIDHLDEVHPGLQVAEWGFQAALDAFGAAAPFVVLDREGVDVRAAPGDWLRPGIGFVLSDHRPFGAEEEAVLREVAIGRLSVGPHWLHGHAAVFLIQDALDRVA